MNKSAVLLVGAGIGTAFYFLDPAQGARRRALVYNKASRARHQLQEATRAAGSDVRNRVQGVRASWQSRSDDAPSDATLMERVRAAIGHVTGTAGAIEVSANQGVVTLTGPVLANEAPLVIDRTLDVRGVRDVENRLQYRQEAGAAPALKASRTRNFRRRLAGTWPPAARVAAGVVGGLAALYGFTRLGLVRNLIGVAGLGLIARAATDTELRQLTGLPGRRYAIRIQKTVQLQAPVERVFEIWSQPENFPNFMTHAREVHSVAGTGDRGRWHWKVRGSSGMEFEFDSKLTALKENRYIAWESEPGAWVEHTGSVRFTPNRDGTTTADVRMSYRPIAGAVGHVIAKLLGDDPKHQLDDDLMRMKSFLETGRQPHDAAAAARQTH